MKITGAKLTAFLKAPDPGAQCVLLYGPDRGLVRERADILARKVVDDLSDPFRVVELTAAPLRSDPARLADEAAAISFTGGRRVVRIRDAADALTKLLKAFIEHPAGDALVLLEAGELGPRSSLRRLFEQADMAAAIACYGDDARSLSGVIRETLQRHGLTASPEALAYLNESLGADRVLTRNELEKLALFKGQPGTITIEDARACVGDTMTASMDDVAYATANGDAVGLERSLARAFAEGLQAVSLIRANMRHFQRLHLVRASVEDGRRVEQAMGALRPPVIFRLAGSFKAQVGKWDRGRLSRALTVLTEAELSCKTTGLPAEAICGRAFLEIARLGRASRPQPRTGR